jgi:prepilin-type N-terminal cleavage/methylation domain-containing protein
MMRIRASRDPRERGYTLVEMLVVVAIIGMISLVTVPNFVVYQRSAKLKSSLRQLTNDLRYTRQMAISRNCRTKISFQTDTAPGVAFSNYRIFEERTHPTTGGRSWAQIGSGKLDPTVYFYTTNFPDEVAPNDDGTNDVIFLPNGTIGNNPVAGGTLGMRTDQKIPKKIITITFSITGQFNTAAS